MYDVLNKSVSSDSSLGMSIVALTVCFGNLPSGSSDKTSLNFLFSSAILAELSVPNVNIVRISYDRFE